VHLTYCITRLVPAIRRRLAPFKRAVWTTPRSVCELAVAYCEDFIRFATCSSALRQPGSTEAYDAYVTLEYHRLEKGMSLTSPRKAFGKTCVEALLRTLEGGTPRFGVTPAAIHACIALRSYFALNSDTAVDDYLADAINRFNNLMTRFAIAAPEDEATVAVRSPSEAALTPNTFGAFLRSRHSTRRFAPCAAELGDIMKAISDARFTPSVCNRQAWRVHVYPPGVAQHILHFQNGNRGFRDEIQHVLIITSPLNHFFSPGERFQGYVDCGMFAMSLVLALHSRGLVTCCLNLSQVPAEERALQRAANIPKHEACVMMIAIGIPLSNYRVAKSSRKDLEEIVNVHLGSTSSECT
jgi:nitroreductase